MNKGVLSRQTAYSLVLQGICQSESSLELGVTRYCARVQPAEVLARLVKLKLYLIARLGRYSFRATFSTRQSVFNRREIAYYVSVPERARSKRQISPSGADPAHSVS